MIVGEALINDGTALVLFNLLYALVATHPADNVTPINIFIYFVKVIFISPLVGGGFGLIALSCMRIANRRMKEEDTTIQMAITLSCAYLSFFVAEHLVHVSGVISCCSAALVLARFATPLVLKPETLHSIWAALEWVGNTVIFFLAGLIIGVRSINYIHAVDIGYILLSYVLIFVIRAIMIAFYYPAMTYLGKGCTPRDAVFMTWGGLRGAVSMALALSLVQSTENGETIISATDSHRVFFLVGGIAALTLIINATTSGYVLKSLDLKGGVTTEDMHILFHYVKKRIRLKAFRLLESIQTKHPDLIDPDFIIRSCSLMGAIEEEVHEVNKNSSIHVKQRRYSSASTGTEGLEEEKKTGAESKTRKDVVNDLLRRALSTSYGEPIEDYNHALNDTITHIATTRERGKNIYRDNRQLYRIRSLTAHDVDLNNHHFINKYGRETKSALMDEIRRAFLNVVRLNYWRQINSGRLPRKSSAALVLLNSIDVALETTNTPGLQDWDHIAQNRQQLFREVITAFEVPSILSPDPSNRGLQMYSSDMDLVGRMEAAERERQSATARLESDHSISLANNTDQERYYRIASSTEQISSTPNRSSHLPALSCMREHVTPPPGSPTQVPALCSTHTSANRLHQYDQLLREYRFSQAVYILTSFIEAHEYAQRTIPFYLGELETIDTPEEALVVQESQDLVSQAKEILQHINPSIIRRQLSKQAARWILHLQEDMIEAFLTEGILTEAQAELLFHEVEHDLKAIKESEWYDIFIYKIARIAHSSVDYIMDTWHRLTSSS